MPNPKKRIGAKKKSGFSALPRIPHILLFIDSAGAYGRGIIEGIGRYSLENGPWSIQYEYRALDSMTPEWLNQWEGDGIIARTVGAKQAKILQKTKVPLVELLGDPKFSKPHVRIDFPLSNRMVFEHFLNCGLRQFGFFSYGDAWWVQEHRDDYCRVVKEHGYDCHVFQTPPSGRCTPVWRENQRPDLVRWICSLPRPIGVATVGDLHAIRLMNYCRDLNLAVPEEVAIMGVGNDYAICETVRPTLSSVDLNASRIGYEAASLLHEMMKGKQPKEVKYVPPGHIVIRQSTDLVAIEDADIIRAMRFIRDFACMGIDVPRVAHEIGMSRRLLETRFFRHIGRTPKAEIMRIKIEHAKKLLTRTEKIGENIAHKCGFSSLVYFFKAFRREVGVTPNAYRKMRRVSRDSIQAPKD
jgi:LacI family transcriptional regulator